MTIPAWVTQYWVEWLFGLIAAGLIWAWRHLAAKVKREQAEQAAIKTGLQALLRAQMVTDFNHYSEKGYAPIYAKENFENCWLQYEKLGQNGVMSNIRARFMNLPTEKEIGRHED